MKVSRVLRKLLGVLRDNPVWATLCIASADGSNPQYPADEKHALLVMVRAPEEEVQSAIVALLPVKGWRDAGMMRVKKLAQPFRSDDPVMVQCYKDAVEGNGGIVVYLEAVGDDEPIGENSGE